MGDATTAAAAKSANLNVTAAAGGVTGVVIADRSGKIVPALGKLKVREALNYALNRKGITQTVYNSYGTATNQYEPEGALGYVPGLQSTYSYDPAKAKKLLAAAGYPHGFSFKLLVEPGVPGGTLLAQAMQQEWSAVGVHVSLTAPTTFADFAADSETKKYPATTFIFAYANWVEEEGELFGPAGTYNFLGVSTPAANSLASKIDVATIGSSQAAAAYNRLQSYVVKQALSVPVSAAYVEIFSAKNLGGISFTPAYPIPDPTDIYKIG